MLLPKWPWHLSPSDHQHFNSYTNLWLLASASVDYYLLSRNRWGSTPPPKRCNNKNPNSWNSTLHGLALTPSCTCSSTSTPYLPNHPPPWHSVWDPTLSGLLVEPYGHSLFCALAQPVLRNLQKLPSHRSPPPKCTVFLMRQVKGSLTRYHGPYSSALDNDSSILLLF